MSIQQPLARPISNSLEKLRNWQRFHFRLTLIYSGTVFLAIVTRGLHTVKGREQVVRVYSVG